jgi:hypothetical protein
MNITLSWYALNAWSPSDSPQVAQALAIRGAAATIAPANIAAVALSLALFIITFFPSAKLH